MTEEKEVYKSIFDAASKIEKRKFKRPPGQAQAGQAAGTGAGRGAEGSQKPPSTAEDDLKAQFEECRRLHNLLTTRLEKMLSERKITIKDLRAYFSSARNFSDKEWALISKEKKTIDTMLNKLVPRLKEPSSKGAKGERKEKAPKKMQVKSRWISMH